MLNRLLIAIAISLLCACDQPEAPMPEVGGTDPGPPSSYDFNAPYLAARVFAEYYEEYLKLNPINATFNGDNRFNDQLPNFLSAEHRAKQLQVEQEFLNRLTAIDRDSLAPEVRLSYDIFKRQREEAVRGFEFPAHLIPVNQFYNIANTLAQLGSGTSAQPFATVQDYDNWLARIHAIPALINQAIDNMSEGVEQGVVQPKILMERVLPQLSAHIKETPTDSLFYAPISQLPDSIDPTERQRLTTAYVDAITNTIVPSYRKLHDYIENDYLPNARDSHGLGALPDGKAWYDFNVSRITTTDLSAEQIHQIGLDEVARIQAEMKQVMKQVSFTGDLQAFFEFTKTDPQFYYTEREQLLDAYRQIRTRIDQGTTRLFSVFPKADYEVRAVEPFREKSAAGGSYQSPSDDGSRPGIFYVNTYDLSARPNWAVESLFLHEAAPGHHFQIAIQQELSNVPTFRRFGRSTAYVEGWALYAESIGKELGAYQDPYQHFGALAAELWRAVRLVVDTGFHAKGWSREQVLTYMYDNTPTAQARAVAEAERYMAIPGQALAYKIGQLKISELRQRAETALGDKFDLKSFHTEVLKDGAVPLDILEAKIDSWIAAQS